MATNNSYEENYLLQKKPWKVWMSSTPNPTAVLVSAQELIDGASLGHNILIYNGNIYQNGVFSAQSFNDFYRYMIDITPAVFDKRSKSGNIKLNTENIKATEYLGRDEVVVNLYNKDAALYPENIKTQWGVNNLWKQYFRSNSTMISDVVGVSYQTGEGFSCESTTQDIAYATVESDIIVYQRDEIFSNTMAFEDGKSAFTKLKVNIRNPKIMKLIVGAILFNAQESDVFLNGDKVINDANIAHLYQEFDLLNRTTKLFEHIYLWVKAPFCADYIDPDDFNQNLNQDADVTHRNLLLSSNYVDLIRNNFNRFNEGYDYSRLNNENIDDPSNIAEFLEKFSRPYTPTNSPLKDFISNDLALIEGIEYDFDKHQDVADAAEKFLERSYNYENGEVISLNKDSVLGAVLGLPVRQDGQTYTRLTPFNFYDPDSRETADFYTELGRFPTLIGKEGNITTDGRIMSPTIDELWYIIKKMISGEQVSNAIPSNIAIPHNDVAQDTTLTEAINAQYKWNLGTGVKSSIDPINFEYRNQDGMIVGIDVKEYVVQPENVNHKIYTLLNTVSDRLNKFYKEQVEIIEDFVADENTGNITYQGNSRDLSKVGDYVIGTTKMGVAASSGREYGPRSSAPLSLRELEAAILGNKYNIENNFVFASKTFGVTGKFGKQLKDDEGDIISAGSLYQFHRDYNADVEHPNTYFKLEGINTPETGSDVTAGDLNGEIEVNDESPAKIPVYILDENLKRTEDTNTNKLPVMVAHYGQSTLLSQRQGKYTGADVYMAADGTWRYKAEHMRLPILRSRY